MIPTLLTMAALLVAPSEPVADLGEGPIDFRCDSGQMFTKPNRAICRNNVVVRRGELLVCCHLFEGFANDEGTWERFVCSDDVRARRGSEIMWANKAVFILETSDLILTGRPAVQRGQSIFRGERIVIHTKSDRARIERPRGTMQPADTPIPAADTLPLKGALPARCPIQPAPKN